MKRCSTSLIIREIQTKTTVRYHLTLVRMAIIKNLQIINAGEGVEKKETYYTVTGNVNCCSHYGEQCDGHLKSKNRVTIWSCNLTLGHISGKNSNSKTYMHPNVPGSTINNSQDVEATLMSIDRWIKKMWYMYNGILLSHKKEWNNALWSTMNGLRDYHIKWSMSERERQISCDFTYMWNLKTWYK